VVGQSARVAQFADIPLDISVFRTRCNYSLGLGENHFERILAGCVAEHGVPIHRGREVTGFAQADTGIDVVASSPRTRRCE
jgi:3-(3-hydroxy-phenyl)propionate hydroxylase